MAAATADAAAGRIVDAKDNSNIQIEWGFFYCPTVYVGIGLFQTLNYRINIFI